MNTQESNTDTITHDGFGWIEVICGSMFSGKTEELMRRIKRADIADQQVKVFKPAVDTRYHETNIVSHNGKSISAVAVQSAKDILSQSKNIDVIGIDEAQFFDDEIVSVCNTLANNGSRVIVAGLDMDFKGQPFGAMPHLMAIAEYVSKLHAVCKRTGKEAHYTFRKTQNHDVFLLGESDAYEPLSRAAYYKAVNNS